VIIAKEIKSGRIAAMAACAVNELYIEGKPIKTGYLFNLRVAKLFRKRFNLFSKGFDFLFEYFHKKGVQTFFTSILDDNLESTRFLEKQRPGMPQYRHIGAFVVYGLCHKSLLPLTQNITFKRSSINEISELISFLNNEGSRNNFFPVIKEENLLNDKRFPKIDDFYCLYDLHGKIIAAGALWNQSDFKQYKVKGYKGYLSILQPISFLFPLFGYPALPGKEENLNILTLSFWAVSKEHEKYFIFFIKCLQTVIPKSHILIVGVDFLSANNKELKKNGGFSYKSKIYEVINKKSNPENISNKSFYIETGRL
ncbi:MAG: hypothetical protein ACD_79C01224G0002, partial [uncultured bacterium]